MSGRTAHGLTPTSPTIFLPDYHGVDIADPKSEALRHIDQFFRLDLTTTDFVEFPNSFYDAILMSHVVEHIMNGESVIQALAPCSS